MKKNVFLGLLIFLLTFSFISCGDDNGGDSPPPTGTPTGTSTGTVNNNQVYNMDGTQYTGSGAITAFNQRPNPAIDHGTVGSITNGVLNFSLPSTIPENQLYDDAGVKYTSLTLSHGSLGLYLGDVANQKYIMFVYATSAGNVTGPDSAPVALTQGWNFFDVTGNTIGNKIASTFEAAYNLGYKWILVPLQQGGGGGGQEDPKIIQIEAKKTSGDQSWGMYSRRLSPFYTGTFKPNANYEITLTGTIGITMPNAAFQIFCFYPSPSTEPPLNILLPVRTDLTAGNFEVKLTTKYPEPTPLTSEDFGTLPSNDIYYSIWSNNQPWPAGVNEDELITTITNFNIVIVEK